MKPHHPLQALPCCPRCGSSNFPLHDHKSRRCADCGLTYYANPSAAVAALIFNERGEMLVERRALDPAKGMLDLPGGFCDPYETVEDAVRREVKEETGLTVNQMSYLGSQPNIYQWQGTEVHTLDLFFCCTVATTDAQAADDAAECMWMRPENIVPEQFGMASIRKFIELYLEN